MKTVSANFMPRSAVSFSERFQNVSNQKSVRSDENLLLTTVIDPS